MKQVPLSRAMWSPRWSQYITGYDTNGEFVYTDRVWSTDKEDIYSTSDGQTEYVIQSWAPDGRGYGDKKEQSQ